MSIEQLLAENTAALNANTAVLQVLNAGREASLDQLKKAAEAGEAAPAARATRKKKTDEAPAVTETVTEGAVTAPTTAAAPAAGSDGLSAIETELKAAVTAHIEGGTTDDEKRARIGDITAIMQHFGGKLVGPQSTLDDDQKAQVLFYVRRYAAGCPVDFSQDYDFAGDPTQGGAADAAGDDFDIG